MKMLNTAVFAAILFSNHAFAINLHYATSNNVSTAEQESAEDYNTPTFMDEFDPSDPNAEAILNAYDIYYEQETGMKAHVDGDMINLFQLADTGCVRLGCPVWVRVNKTTQSLSLYLNGDSNPVSVWPVSTGYRHKNGTGIETPNLDTHPNGRIYDRYSSTKFPGGDYMGLGNMPYVVFIKGGVGIHGTPQGNWSKLGKKASHGCIRIHPDNAKYFNQLVRSTGIRNVWVTVE